MNQIETPHVTTLKNGKKPARFVVCLIVAAICLLIAASFALVKGRPVTAPSVSHRTPAWEHPVVVIGLDGASWNVILPLIEAGQLNNIKMLMEEGTYGVLKSAHPLLSPAVWTTIATGQPLEKHGIPDFTIGDRIVRSTDRKVKAVWNYASDSGLRCGIVAYMKTWPAEELNGFLVTDRPWAHWEPEIVYPDNLRYYLRELWPWQTESEENARKLRRFINYDYRLDFETLNKDSREYTWNHIIKTHLQNDYAYTEGLTKLGMRLFKRNLPHLYMVHYHGIDHVSHGFWQYMEPEYFEDVQPEETEMFGGAITNFYIYMDEIIGRYIDQFPEDCTFVILSDHGFGPITHRLPEDRNFRSGRHTLDGILIMKGKPIRAGTRLQGVTIFDIAPTLLYLLQLPIPDVLSGRPPMEAFTDDYVARHAVKIESINTQRQISGGEGPESSVDEEIKERLRGLGYLQ